MGTIIVSLLGVIVSICLLIVIYDRFIQNGNVVIARFPLLGRFRYLSHGLRPFIRQYFLDDNDFVNRIVIDWILHVASGKTGYFSFDKFDSARELHNGEFDMIHSSTPLNQEETAPQFPLVGQKRKYPFQFQSYIYRSAMSLGALGFEATSAMAAGCADAKAPFNTGEGGFAIHHIPRVEFSPERKFFKSVHIPKILKPIYLLAPGNRMKNRMLDVYKSMLIRDGKVDLYLFSKEHFCFYAIDWNAPLEVFPKPSELSDEFGQVILQIGSGLYGLKKHTTDGSIEFDWDRFKKITSFCRAIEIKLAQGAKQSGGILKANKNTPTVAEIRGVEPGHDLISPNRFPFYNEGNEKEFFEFMNELSEKSGGKPIGCKIVISDAKNIEPLVKQIVKTPEIAPDFITIDGGDGGSGAAPIYLSTLFGKRIYAALEMANTLLQENGVRDKVKLFAAAKLYAPFMSAKAMALGADAIGNARSIMISAGCIRAGHCSGEHGSCPVGIATMKKANRRAFQQAWDKKVKQISNFIHAHNHGLIQVAAIAGLKSPSLFTPEYLAKKES